MSFLQPLLLIGLPLAALPIIIHLIHLHRRRTVPWAATMFLVAAQRMNRGYSRLRRLLILALRVLALLALILMAARPLAGGLLGLTGGAPDTVVLLLDRSASMSQLDLATGLSKREAGLRQLADAVKEAYRGRSKLVLIDSATMEGLSIEAAEDLLDLPATAATDSAADIPGLLQVALEHITDNQTGRTDVWLLSDLRRSDWDVTGGRWEAMRQAFAELPGVRFQLLCYDEEAKDNLGVVVDRVVRRESRERAELVFDLQVRQTEVGGEERLDGEERDLELRFVINGATSVLPAKLRDGQLTLSGHGIPIDRSVKRGWGRVELPADSFPADNVWHFVFDEPPVFRSVIVTDDEAAMVPVRAALGAPSDPSRQYEVSVFGSARTAEIPWDEVGLIVWQAPIPVEGEIAHSQLESHVASGRTLLFLPPQGRSEGEFRGLGWGEWESWDQAQLIASWRNDAGPLSNARDGTALPVGEIEVLRRRLIEGDAARQVPLARLPDQAPLISRIAPGVDQQGEGEVYLLGTLPGTGASSLARDGVVIYAFLHRLLDAGAGSLGMAMQRVAGAGALGAGDDRWQRVGEASAPGLGGDGGLVPTQLLPLQAGVLESGERLMALNRPTEEDVMQVLSTGVLGELFAGLDHRVIEAQLRDESSLASEIWRTLLLLMAAALIFESLLSMPTRKRPATVGAGGAAAGLAPSRPAA
jgi:hypothetical protein